MNRSSARRDPGGVVIAGGGLASVRTAEGLRRADYSGPITIAAAEKHLPYDRPPLSKEVLRAETDDVSLKPSDYYRDNDITVLLGNPAVSVDAAAATARLADGSILGYDDLVIATGLVPKRIPAFPDLAGIHVLRTYDDALALRSAAGRATRAVVVGAGFIGCEVAASLRTMGVEVVLVEPQETPLAPVLGKQIGNLVARLHHSEGVDLRCGAGISEVRGSTSVENVILSSGADVEADLVVLGIGSTPATGWLEDSGIALGNGVACDRTGRTSVPHVWAIGDVASWQPPGAGGERVEHWSNVAEQARVLVPAILGRDAPALSTVPYFWSDQYDVKIQCLGTPKPTDTVHLTEDDGRRFLAYYERDGALAAVAGGGMAAKVMKTRAKIAAGAPIADVIGQ